MAAKSGIYSILIELVFGAALIVAGVIRPAFLWNWDFIATTRQRVGDTLMTVILVAVGAAVILWTLVKNVFLRKAST